MRLDLYLAENKIVKSRTKAQETVEKGMVTVNGKTVTKPAFSVSELDSVCLIDELKFVTRGGDKLERAISAFNYDASNKVFLDVGASNGGFTDCLLTHNAKKVYAIDVGKNQLDDKLRKDERVVVMDETNARNLHKSDFSEEELYAVSDVSFISLTYIIPVLSGIVREMILLIKPQFECGKNALNKNGIVTSADDRLKACLIVKEAAEKEGLSLIKLAVGAEGKNKNTEYVCLIGKGNALSREEIAKVIFNR